jgi:transposase
LITLDARTRNLQGDLGMRATEPKRLELSEEEFESLCGRLERDELTAADRQLLVDVVRAVLWMGEELEHKNLSITRLKRLFGIKSESLASLFPAGSKPGADTNPSGAGEDKVPPKGHGKLAAKRDFPGARCIFHPHETLHSGDPCPECHRGSLYATDPGVVLRICGQAPFAAEIHEPEKLRCSACGTIFTAQLPKDVAISGRADPRAHGLLALLRYGSGMPMYRIAQLQKALGIPLPISTQWDMIEETANRLYPVYRELLKFAARAEQFHNDDTTVRILALKKQLAEDESDRTGIFTTGVFARMGAGDGQQEIALFFSGNHHAGENLGKVLKCRPEGLPMPRLMCDALDRNEPAGISMEVAFCLDHARRGFVDVTPRFPVECRHFLERLADVYVFDSQTKEMTDEERLKFHRGQSLRVMEELRAWGNRLLDEKKIEPNSGLGDAIRYFYRHWEKLTAFCRIAGAPLANSIVERLLKRAILHRKNSLFYKTQAGAWVGDVLMSLIETARLSGVNVLEYLTALYVESDQLRRSPERYFPWNWARAQVKAA